MDRNAAAFLALGDELSLTVDDIIRTSRDPRHRPGVERLWRACAQAGDLYRRGMSGLYCTGCEQFYAPAELPGGRCPEHETVPQRVTEENWFFRLSRYAGPLRQAITDGRLRIEPAGRRNEVLAFVDRGLEDFSVSRPAARAGGWGIPVPDDPDQVIYVWFDALCNYVTALGYAEDGDAYRQWWAGGGRRVHLLGKGVLQIPRCVLAGHAAVVGPAAADRHLRARLPDRGRPEDQQVSRLPGSEPAALAAEYGADAVRWWLLREVPRVGDADFTVERLIARADDELANGLGNLVNRVVAMIGRYRDGRDAVGSGCEAAAGRGGSRYGDAGRRRPYRRRAGGVRLPAGYVRRCGRSRMRRIGFINRVRPWELAKAAGERRLPGRRAPPAAGRVPDAGPRAEPVPARRRGAYRRAVHARRRRSPAESVPGVPAAGTAAFRRNTGLSLWRRRSAGGCWLAAPAATL